MIRKREESTRKPPQTVAETPGPIEPQRSLIGQGVHFEGRVTGKADLVIQGTMKGEIYLRGHQVSIEEGARVEADIRAESIFIQGTLKGKVAAMMLVTLNKTASFVGELKAARLRMEDGARLEGSIELPPRVSGSRPKFPTVSPAKGP
ncbi:MAG: polymer-forming cytoskeletal protein [Nitrospinota bacterium]